MCKTTNEVTLIRPCHTATLIFRNSINCSKTVTLIDLNTNHLLLFTGFYKIILTSDCIALAVSKTKENEKSNFSKYILKSILEHVLFSSADSLYIIEFPKTNMSTDNQTVGRTKTFRRKKNTAVFWSILNTSRRHKKSRC